MNKQEDPWALPIEDSEAFVRVCRNPKYTYRVWIVDGFAINIVQDKEPNRFNRWLQKVFLGFRWEKID